MGHERVRDWDDDDREAVRARVVALAERLPGVEVQDDHGHTGLLVRQKKFAWLLVDHHGDGVLGLWVKAPPGEQQALVASDPGRYFAPPYLGPSGWVAAYVQPSADPDWEQVAELVEQAWRMSAGKRAVAAYDADRR